MTLLYASLAELSLPWKKEMKKKKKTKGNVLPSLLISALYNFKPNFVVSHSKFPP
jgi:hypothetical protein